MCVKMLQKAIAKTSIQIMKETSRQIQLNKKQYNFNGTIIQEKQDCNYEDISIRHMPQASTIPTMILCNTEVLKETNPTCQNQLMYLLKYLSWRFFR